MVEERQNRRFLTRIDIPVSDRGIAMRDLATMGVTSASLFPGIEGLCRFLAEATF